MHSTFSDGVLAPALLVEKAVSLGVNVLAMTDHDTFDGVDSLRGKMLAAELITGVELSLRDMHGLHLLGYGMTEAAELRSTVRQLAEKRAHRVEEMVSRLQDMGVRLDWDSMTRGYSGTLGRAHVARAMVAQGYVQSMKEAFDRYIGEGRPAYVEGERLSMAEALPLMRSNGFVPVLAHPAQLNKDETTLRILLQHWQHQGLMGLEAYHPCQAGNTARYDRLARSMGLLVTGGSDYHKDGDSHGMPGCMAAAWQQAEQDVQRLKEAIQKENDKHVKKSS